MQVAKKKKHGLVDEDGPDDFFACDVSLGRPNVGNHRVYPESSASAKQNFVNSTQRAAGEADWTETPA